MQTALAAQPAAKDLEPPSQGVLVGFETGDDAGVWLFDGAAPTGIVTTADFITPPFDDPEGYGRIAAANALSDVYAMGGRPVCALNLCMFPRALDLMIAREILDGARAVLSAVGAALVGGHTVFGSELFFGLSVTGVVDPTRIWRNVGARPGDVLLLTRPLGSGLIISGARRGLTESAERTACAAMMAEPNRRAAEILARFPISAATDVTGFGLIGHALGMARDVSLRIEFGALPVYAGARRLAAIGVSCAGARANRQAYRERVGMGGAMLAPADEEILYDPQTSGGLLVALPEGAALDAERALHDAAIPAARIGEVRAPHREDSAAPLLIVAPP